MGEEYSGARSGAMTYDEWIAAFVLRCEGHVFGRCSSATTEMVAAFPELRRVAGFVGSTEHFWCVAPDGQIVDPTAEQFAPWGGVDSADYREFQPGDEVRVGRCMNCGVDIYATVQSLNDPLARRSSCGPECDAELVASL